MSRYAGPSPSGDAARGNAGASSPWRRGIAALALLSLASVVGSPLAAVASPPAVGSSGTGFSVPSPVTVPAGPVPTVTFRWPLGDPPRVVRRFDPPPQPWLAGHRGVDLAAAPGSVVRAAGAGVVHFAGRIADRGVVSVSHPGGLRTTYEPVEPSVATGDRVDAGDPIGVLVAGHPNCSASACLHWGLRRGEEYLDPLSLLGLGRVRLLPIRRAGSPTRRRLDRPGPGHDVLRRLGPSSPALSSPALSSPALSSPALSSPALSSPAPA